MSLDQDAGVRMPDVEIYTQPYCPYCVRAVQILTQKGVAFREIDAPHGTQERLDARERSGGGTTVPQIFVDGQSVGGCTELMALDRAGKLDSMLGLA